MEVNPTHVRCLMASRSMIFMCLLLLMLQMLKLNKELEITKYCDFQNLVCSCFVYQRLQKAVMNINLFYWVKSKTRFRTSYYTLGMKKNQHRIRTHKHLQKRFTQTLILATDFTNVRKAKCLLRHVKMVCFLTKRWR